MKHSQRRNKIDNLMQAFPVFAEAFFPNIERGDRERDQQKKCDRANDKTRLFKNFLNKRLHARP